MTELIDASWLVDSITIAKAIEDDWQNTTYPDPITLDNVRVDLTKQYTGTGNNREIVANATVFLFARFTGNYFVPDDDWLKSKVVYNGHEYLATDYVVNHGIETNKPYSVELKVI
ncbi:putative minor capsid protein [Latilactobacillus sakei]|uniref:putative minor capsid protein n=1 Tax=Latilactobacillus sakei TaxID=1599 RepID=UPI0038850A70